MAEWLLHQTFFLFNAFGACAVLMFGFFTIAAIWGLVKGERFRYLEFVNVSVPAHVFIWLLSLFSSATSLQAPEEFELNWSLSSFNYDDFLGALQISIYMHIVMAGIIFTRLKFNHHDT